MARLHGMNLVYRAWENRHESNNIPHPDADQYHGGLGHLTAEERQRVLNTNTVPTHVCCTDPYWLFRIYQDTRVDEQELSHLIDEALREVDRLGLTQEPRGMFHTHSFSLILIVHTPAPGVVDTETIKCVPVFDSEKKVASVKITWDTPWNGVQPEAYAVWEHISYTEYITPTNSAVLQHPRFVYNETLQIWIRTRHHGELGPYSGQVLCPLVLP
jgi:hypothetical protein